MTQTQTTLPVEGLRTTRYSDVCGGTDEFKRLLREEPQQAGSAAGREALLSLLDDGMYMLGRMELRLREYQQFRDTMARLAAAMQTIEEPRLAGAAAAAAALRERLQGAPEGPPAAALVQHLIDMEGALRRHKEAVIEAGRAYLRLRGRRGWDDGSPAPPGAPSDGAGPAAQDGAQDGAAPPAGGALPPGVPEAWLPPSPHREVIVDWLKRGRAALLTEEEASRFPPGPQGREPLVQFEDGGVMPLRVVRWSDEVSNFYPLGATPHPRGRLYRKRDT
jgi:hypothetical protein